MRGEVWFGRGATERENGIKSGSTKKCCWVARWGGFVWLYGTFFSRLAFFSSSPVLVWCADGWNEWREMKKKQAGKKCYIQGGEKKIWREKKKRRRIKHIERPTSQNSRSHSLGWKAFFTTQLFCANHFYVLKHHECFMYCHVFSVFHLGAWISLFSHVPKLFSTLPRSATPPSPRRPHPPPSLWNIELGVRWFLRAAFVCRFFTFFILLGN